MLRAPSRLVPPDFALDPEVQRVQLPGKVRDHRKGEEREKTKRRRRKDSKFGGATSTVDVVAASATATATADEPDFP